MKKILLMAVATMMTVICVKAQTFRDSTYVMPEDMPNACHYLPAPPDTANYIYIDDLAQWQWGKTERYSKRGDQADRESMKLPNIMRMVMAEVLELDTISDETTPALSRLLVRAYCTGMNSVSVAKEKYIRKRPFKQMNEKPWAQYDDELFSATNSYPSRHASFGWSTALIFAEMWPELQDSLLCRGIEYGVNRVITGAHWQSDVTAGYLCAAAAVARAHRDARFDDDIRAARAEYAQLKGVSVPETFPIGEAIDVPHGERFLPAPVDTASARYMADLMLYWSNKPIRYTERGDTARIEAEYSVSMMQKVMGEAMDMKLSDEDTPAITALLAYVLEKASNTADRLKSIRFRKRPFVQIGEPSFVAGDEEKERGKSSFPSGHTNLGWSTALVMAELAPDHQDEILRRGYEYGHNRLIVGYHWYTDIETTRQLASGLVARLHADPTFIQLMAAARTEYESITTAIDPAPQVNGRSSMANGTVYRLDGIPATETTRGIVIEDGKKMMRQ